MKRSLRKARTQIPKAPGVYLFENDQGEIIYVGKATNLSARISQYFHGKDPRPNVQFLLKRIANFRYIQCASPEEALCLETDLIKKYRPKYNIKAKDDSGNTHIAINMASQWPYFFITNFVKPAPGTIYFGPYPSRKIAKILLESIRLAYPLRSCSDSVFYNRLRPCMEYELGRCLAPCCLEVSKDEYASLIEKATSALRNENDEVIQVLQKKLDRASADLRFEDCILLRDGINALKNYAKKEYFHKGQATDFIAADFTHAEGHVCFMRAIGMKIVDVNVRSFENWYDLTANSLIEHYYSTVGELPSRIAIHPSIIVDTDLLNVFFSAHLNQEVEILSPEELGEHEKRLLELAKINASHYGKSAFYKRVEYTKLTQLFAKELKLKEVPLRIECLDISNLAYKHICAGIAVFIEGEPQRDHYMVFKLKQTWQDDFGAIEKALKERVKRKEPLFDLMVIDGGAGHLSVALKTLKRLNIHRPVIAIAKKKTKDQFERVFVPHSPLPVLLKEGTVLHSFFVCLRDEAHRTANTFNRFLRSAGLRKK